MQPCSQLQLKAIAMESLCTHHRVKRHSENLLQGHRMRSTKLKKPQSSTDGLPYSFDGAMFRDPANVALKKVNDDRQR